MNSEDIPLTWTQPAANKLLFFRAKFGSGGVSTRSSWGYQHTPAV